MKAAGLKFEIVFASSDKDEEAFTEYHGEMPWLAIPFSDRDTKNALSKRFKVSGIPTFVILDSDGNTITTDGRSAITEDPNGENFPWIPPKFKDVIGNEFISGNGSSVSWGDIVGNNEAIGIYFSAHWCPPCRGFTPKLVQTYNALKAQNKRFEVIFASSDRDQASFDEYFGEMPWLAVPFADRRRKEALSKVFGVEGIPMFVVLDSQGDIINGNARGAVSSDPEGKDFPWAPKPVSALDSPDGINETPSMVCLYDCYPLFFDNFLFSQILFTDQCSDEVTKTHLRESFFAFAAAVFANAKANQAEPEVLFFLEETASDVGSRIRALTGLQTAESKAQLVLLDIPDEGGFYPGPSDVGVGSFAEFWKAYSTKALERSQLS